MRSLFATLVLYAALLWIYAGANSAVFDEGMHLAAGYRYWECADYGINPEHPPLAKLVAALPIRHWRIGEFDRPCGARATKNADLIGIGYRLLNSAQGDEVLRSGRTAMMVFPILLFVTVYFAARAWFGETAAIWTTLLLLVEPNLTAHSVLVTTDMALAATTLLTVFVAWRYLRKPNMGRLAALGAAMGLALASKHSGILVPPIALAVMVADAPRIWLRSLAAWAGASVIALVVLWSTYQFRFHALPNGKPAEFGIVAGSERTGLAQTLPGKALALATRWRLLPESYSGGLTYVVDNSTRETYLFGKQLPKSVWYYFPVAISIKTPFTLLMLVALAFVARGAWKVAMCWIPPAMFLLFAMMSGMGLGIRHVLPVYPFLVILAGAGAAQISAKGRWATATCAALLLFQAISYARSFPNQIAYANEAWGGPKHLRSYLADSNLDWGQSLPRVKEYAAKHGVQDCWIAWFGMRKPEAAGVPCKALAGPSFLEATDSTLPPVIPERFSGTVLVSATLLENDLFPYRWLRSKDPVDVIGGDVVVYRGAFDRPEVAAERQVARGWWYLNHGQGARAVDEFTAAEPHANARGMTHSLFGWALASVGRYGDAAAVYEKAAKDYEGRPADAAYRRSALEAAAGMRKADEAVKGAGTPGGPR